MSVCEQMPKSTWREEGGRGRGWGGGCRYVRASMGVSL